MIAEDLLKQARFQLNDTDKVEFSDEELLGYLNQALLYINNLGITLNSRIFIKSIDITLSDGKATLPGDFVREKRIIAGDAVLKSNIDYQIYGNEIYTNADSITLEYYFQLPALTSLSDEIPLKDIFANILKQIVVFLALNRTNVNANLEVQLSQLYEKQLRNIFKLYGNTRFERKLPYRL